MGLFDNMYGFNPNTIQTPAYPQARITTTPNPNSAQIMQLIQANGGDPKAAFYSLAKQRGINPEDFLKALQ